MEKNYKSQISNYYLNAKLLVKQNKPNDARAYVLAFVNLSREIYHTQTGILAKANTKSFLLRWVGIATVLREQGITDDVLQAFDLLTKTKTSAPKVSPSAPKLDKTSATKPVLPSKNVDIDLDGLTSGVSQGWCADLFEQYKSSVVSVKVLCANGATSGTGFIISSNGYILTNDHIVYDDDGGGYFSNITMSFADSKKAYKLDVIASDKRWDIALCAFNASQAPAFSQVPRIKDYSSLKQGADILIIGNGFSMGLAPFTGTVKFTHDNNGNLVYTAPSNPGDSGGPVFNRIGKCVGINKSITKAVSIGGGAPVDANCMTNATPMDEIDKLLAKWETTYEVKL